MITNAGTSECLDFQQHPITFTSRKLDFRNSSQSLVGILDDVSHRPGFAKQLRLSDGRRLKNNDSSVFSKLIR